MDPKVATAVEPFYSKIFYNPSAVYSGAREAKNALDDARHSVAKNIGARPSEITFTAGGTESANLAIRGVMESNPDAELVVSAIEHDAVIEPAKKYNVKFASVDKNGIVSLKDLEKKVSPKTILVSIMYANNEVGTVQPIKDVVALVAKIRKQRKTEGNKLPLYVHTDACQAPQYLDVNVARLGVDMMTLNGGKLYGPKQSGILYHKIGVVLEPQILGGGQELGLRSGTENVANCVGFAKALELSLQRQKTTLKHVREIAEIFINKLESEFGAVLNGHRKLRLPSNIHVTFPNCDNERVLFSLDDQGVYASAGSACSASNEESSHVLLAMGMSEEEARSSVRFSIGKETTKADIGLTIKKLAIALKA